jgi:hypothetical protein
MDPDVTGDVPLQDHWPPWGFALLPGVDAFVVLEDEEQREHHSQVKAVSAQQLTLARPPVTAGSALLVGAEVTLVWPEGTRAVNKVGARIAAMRRDADAALLDLQVVGEPWREQRRKWVRVPATGLITVTEVVDGARSLAPRTAPGDLLDISEVATRCVIDAQAIWACRRNARVRVSFFLGDDEIDLAGQVFTSSVSSRSPNRREIVVRFDEPVPAAETLRRHVLSHEEADDDEPAASGEPETN